jgi:hypothetical protein
MAYDQPRQDGPYRLDRLQLEPPPGRGQQQQHYLQPERHVQGNRRDVEYSLSDYDPYRFAALSGNATSATYSSDGGGQFNRRQLDWENQHQRDGPHSEHRDGRDDSDHSMGD